MNLTALKTWVSGETLTASDLNAEYQNIYNHTITNSDIDSTGTYVLGELVVGSGITAADGGQLHVHTASAGSVQAHADANEAVLENSAASGLSILSGSSSDGNIFFGDAADNDIGKIAYSHSANSLAFVTNGTTALTLSSAQVATFAGNVSIGGTLTLTGGISLNGNTTIGDSASDTLTINSTITSHLKFTDNTYDLGASGATRPRHLYLSGNAVLGGGITSGNDIVSDTDSTDDLGTTSVRWANLYADSIGDSGQALAVKATTLSFDAASTIDTSGNNNLTLDAGTATLTLDANTIESDASTLSFDAAATIDTSGNNNLSLDAGTATLTLDAGTIESDAGTLSFDAAASIDTSGNNALAISTGSANLNITAATLALTGAQTISSTLTATGATTIGAGQAVNAKALLTLTSTTSAGYGGEIQFHKNSASTAEIGNESAVLGSGTSSDLFLASDGAIDFATGGTTQRMTITTGGDLGIGTASPLGDSKIHTVTGTASSYTPAGNTQAIFEHTAASASIARVGIIAGQGTGFSVLDFGDSTGPTNGGITYKHETDEMFFATTNGTTKMSIQSGTEVWIANTSDQGAYNLQVGGTGVWGAGAYVNGSDEKIKQSITTYNDDATVLVSQMRPVTFEYTEEYSRDRATQVGFIAQDLQQVLDGKSYADGIVKEDSNQLNVAYQSLIPILTKAIQELTQRVKELESN